LKNQSDKPPTTSGWHNNRHPYYAHHRLSARVCNHRSVLDKGSGQHTEWYQLLSAGMSDYLTPVNNIWIEWVYRWCESSPILDDVQRHGQRNPGYFARSVNNNYHRDAKTLGRDPFAVPLGLLLVLRSCCR